MFCTNCGEYTTKRNFVGEALCNPCAEQEDQAVAAWETAQATRMGFGSASRQQYDSEQWELRQIDRIRRQFAQA